jgi:methyl-accepting chemotaxis protein
MENIGAVVEENTAVTQEMLVQANGVSAAIRGIAAVVEEQSTVTDGVRASADEMRLQIEDTGTQSRELAATADQLRELVARFTLNRAVSAKRAPVKVITSLRRAA